MSNNNPISLTTSELGYLWTGLAINNMSKWYLTVFCEHSQDKEIKDLYSFALQITNDLIVNRDKLLSNEGYPVPIGFLESDINVSAPPLFSNRFLLKYLHIAVQLGLEFHSRSLALSTRVDVRNYNIDCLNASIQLHERTIDMMLNKGIYWRTPTLPSSQVPKKIQKSSYLNGWIGGRRPFNSMELANLYEIIDLLIVMEALCIGFTQTSDTEEVAKLFQEGTTVIRKQYSRLSIILEENELPVPSNYSAEVLGSKDRVFSDRIMVCHLAGLFGSLLSQYGFSIGSVMRHDLVVEYTMLISKVGSFSEKITRFLIEKEWLEKVPGSILRGFD
ncbi:DUF3231 family protein [Neobacillus niacini]|uniref:DUF3231 family protein n=1 Tax=Neobacillus niacini TaxID=86668 RepID=UPI003B020877